jgi:hypothetical protein
LSGWDLEDTLHRVKDHVVHSKIIDRLLQICGEAVFLPVHHRNVVHICVNVTTYLICQAPLHGALVHCSCALWTEGYCYVKVHAIGCDK